MGYDADAATVSNFANGSESACVVDRHEEVFGSFGAYRDDIFITDAEQVIRFWMSLASAPLSDSEQRLALESAVRDLL